VERRFAADALPLALHATLHVYDAHTLVRLASRLEHIDKPADAPIALARVFLFVTGA
jgi:hypothetical protein